MFAPLFAHALARVRGGMHIVLVSWSGRVYTTGHKNKYQLCLGDAYNNTAFVDYSHKVRLW